MFTIGCWDSLGHTRPLCTLALRMIQERPMNITFFTVPNFVKRIESELSRNFDPETDHLRELIRYVVIILKPKKKVFDVIGVQALSAWIYPRVHF